MQDFYYVLFTTLLANCPVDNRNMVQNITLTDYGDHWLIKISGPRMSSSGFYDYAKKVNAQISPTQSGPNKGKVNYQWVERTIKQVSHVFGREVKYELS